MLCPSIIVGILNIAKRSFPDPVSSGFDLGVLRNQYIDACMAICARLLEDLPLKTIMINQINIAIPMDKLSLFFDFALLLLILNELHMDASCADT